MLPTELKWTFLFLLHKGNAYSQGIRMLEVLWKLVESIINTFINTDVVFHDILHVFCAFIGTGVAIVSINMAQ